MDSCLLLVLEPRAPGSLGVNNDDNYFHMYIHTRYFLSSFRDEIPILNFRSTSHIYIYVYNKAYYWEENNANGETRVRWSNERILFVGIPYRTRARIKHSMNWYSIYNLLISSTVLFSTEKIRRAGRGIHEKDSPRVRERIYIYIYHSNIAPPSPWSSLETTREQRYDRLRTIFRE